MGISIYILFKGFQTIDYSFLNIKSITYETIQIDDPNFRIRHFPWGKSNPYM